MRVSRRELLQSMGSGFGTLAFAGLLNDAGLLADESSHDGSHSEPFLTPDSQFTCRELAERERDFGSPTSLESALRFDPSVPLAHLLLAGAYMDKNVAHRITLRGSFSPQRIAFLREFDLQHLPDDAALWERAIRALHEQKQTAGAKRALEKLSRLSPEKAAQLKIQLAL